LALSVALVAAIANIRPAFSSNHFTGQSPYDAAGSRLVRTSVIKVHTDHGVITLPGNGDNWDDVEKAVFIADSIADVEMVNNEVPWRISTE
jgi:BON domain